MHQLGHSTERCQHCKEELNPFNPSKLSNLFLSDLSNPRFRLGKDISSLDTITTRTAKTLFSCMVKTAQTRRPTRSSASERKRLAAVGLTNVTNLPLRSAPNIILEELSSSLMLLYRQFLGSIKQAQAHADEYYIYHLATLFVYCSFLLNIVDLLYIPPQDHLT